MQKQRNIRCYTQFLLWYYATINEAWSKFPEQILTTCQDANPIDQVKVQTIIEQYASCTLQRTRPLHTISEDDKSRLFSSSNVYLLNYYKYTKPNKPPSEWATRVNIVSLTFISIVVNVSRDSMGLASLHAIL